MTREEAVKRINDIRRIYARYVEIVTENENEALDMAIKALELVTSYEDTINKLTEALNQQKEGRLTNSEWIDFLSKQFDISRTSAKEMLHVMMSVKKEDNFKKQFSGRK